MAQHSENGDRPRSPGLSRRNMMKGSAAAAAMSLPLGAVADALVPELPGLSELPRIPGPLVEPVKDVIGSMVSAELGPIAGRVVSEQICSLFGLGGGGKDSQQYAAYFAAIDSKLDAIRTDLNGIQNQLRGLEASLGMLIGDVAALSDKVTDLGVQQLFGTFMQNANIITENFASYRNALAAISSPDKNRRAAGGRQLFQLFDTINAMEISTALRNIQDAFVPLFAGRTGLLAYQTELVVAAINEVAADPRTVTLEPYRNVDVPNLKLREVPNDAGVFAFNKIRVAGLQVAREKLNGVIANTLHAFIGVQLHGMVLLSSAWLGTINEPTLEEHVARNKQVLAQFAAFPDAVKKRIDDTIAANLKRFGKPLGTPLSSGHVNWSLAGDGDHASNQFDFACWTGCYPLSDEYIMWDRGLSGMFGYLGLPTVDLLIMVERPWQYEDCRAVGIYYAPSANPATDVLPASPDRVSGQGYGRLQITRFLIGSAPKLAFLKALV